MPHIDDTVYHIYAKDKCLYHNLEKQFQQQYGGPLNNQEEMELLLAIFLVYSSDCLIVDN